MTQSSSGPQRLAPTEATLQSLRDGLYSMIFLPIWIITLFVPREYQFGMLIGNHLTIPMIAIVLSPALQYFIRGEQWKDLDTRRQQAASSTEQYVYVQPAVSYDASIYTSIHMPLQDNKRNKNILRAFLFLVTIFYIGLLYFSWSQQWPEIIQLPSFSGWLLVDMLTDMLIFAPLVYLVPFIFNAPNQNIQQIIITSSGLIAQYNSSVSFIQWQEARLFAIVGIKQEGKRPPPVTYELASATQSIRWTPEQLRNGYNQPYAVIGLWDKPSEANGETREQLAKLSEIVAAHTSLPLQDLRQK